MLSPRFCKKYKKWYGVDGESAKKKWDDYLADRTVDRYYDADVNLFMACPATGTAVHISGSRIGNQRALAEERKVSAGDTDAIRDERNRH